MSSAYLACTTPWVLSLALHKPGVVACEFHPSSREVEAKAGGSVLRSLSAT